MRVAIQNECYHSKSFYNKEIVSIILGEWRSFFQKRKIGVCCARVWTL